MIPIPEDELTVKIVGDVSDIKQKLSEVTTQVKSYGSETAGAAKQASDGMTNGARETTKAVGDTGKAYEETTKTAVEHGKEVRQLIRDIKVSNIEEVQRNQLLQQTGSTFQQWGAKMQGSSNLANKAMTQLTDTVRMATGGVMDYVGAGIQLVGKGIDTYAQISRMILIYKMEAEQSRIARDAAIEHSLAMNALGDSQDGVNTKMGAKSFMGAASVIGGITLAVGLAVTAHSFYTKSVDDAKKKQDELEKSIKATTLAIKEQLSGQTTGTKGLQAELKSLKDQQQAVMDKETAARSLGYEDEANELYKQSLDLQKEIEIAQERVNKEIAKGPDYYEVSKEYGKLAKIATDEYYRVFSNEWSVMHRGIEIWGEAKEQMEADSKVYGYDAAQAYVDGLNDGLSSEEARAKFQQGLKNLSEPIEPGGSPPRVGPLKEVDIWGQDLAKSYTEGFQEYRPAMGLVNERLAESINNNSVAHNDNRRITNTSSPNINISGMMDLTSPNTARLIAKIVNDELRRKAVVS